MSTQNTDSMQRQEWQVERAEGSPLRRTADGHFALPIQISRNGTAIASAPVLLTPAAAEILHAQLCRALDGRPIPSGAPECRYSLQGDPRSTAHRPPAPSCEWPRE